MADDTLLKEAVSNFESIYDEARELDVNEPDAMTLCTCDLEGNPTARVILLRGVDLRGFVFYTNAESRKGAQLAENPRAALCFYWDALRRQIRVEGDVEHVTPEENDRYWSRRPRTARLRPSPRINRACSTRGKPTNNGSPNSKNDLRAAAYNAPIIGTVFASSRVASSFGKIGKTVCTNERSTNDQPTVGKSSCCSRDEFDRELEATISPASPPFRRPTSTAPSGCDFVTSSRRKYVFLTRV